MGKQKSSSPSNEQHLIAFHRAPSKEDSDLIRGSTAPNFDQFGAYTVGNTHHVSSGWELHRNPVMDISAEPSPQEPPRQIQVDEAPLVNKPSSEDRFHILNSIATHGLQLERDNVSFRQTGLSGVISTRPNPTIDDARFSQSGQLEDDDVNPEPESPDSKLASGSHSLDYDQINKLDQTQESSVSSSLESSESARQPEGVTPIDEKAQISPEPKSTETIDVEELDLTDGAVLKFLEKLQSSGVLEKLGYKKEDPVRSEDTQQEPTNNTTGEHRHTCSTCNKGFGRRCELK